MHNEIKGNIEIEKTWVIRSDHITEEDQHTLNLLTRKAPYGTEIFPVEGYSFSIVSCPHTWTITVPIYDDKALEEGLEALIKSGGYSSHLLGLFYICIFMGYKYLKLDANAETIPMLPTFRW